MPSMRYGSARSSNCVSTSCESCSVNSAAAGPRARSRRRVASKGPDSCSLDAAVSTTFGLAILAEQRSALSKLRNPGLGVIQHFLEHLRAMLAQQRSLDVRQIRIGGEFQRKARNRHFA